MAGRGTDIQLVDTGRLGGLYVLGYGRHDSSRLDDQLRGRAGRRGDPGSSEFFTSLDDEILTRHGVGVLTSAEDPRASSAVDQAQRIAQADNLKIHRTTWQYHPQASRQTWLYHLDRRWSQHLAFLADLREGIHRRGLARGLTAHSPSDEFHQEAMRAIRTFTDDVERDAQATFSTTNLEDGDLATTIKRQTITMSTPAESPPRRG